MRLLRIATLAVCVTAIPALAQVNGRNGAPGRAKITMEQARQTALAKEPGRIQSSELEREHGKLIYSFDIRTNSGATREVNVDAMTGKIVEDSVESPQAEQRERRQESKEKHSDNANRAPTPGRI